MEIHADQEEHHSGEGLGFAPMTGPRVILAGGSGFLGTALAGELVAGGHQVVNLSRSPGSPCDGSTELP